MQQFLIKIVQDQLQIYRDILGIHWIKEKKGSAMSSSELTWLGMRDLWQQNKSFSMSPR